MNNRADEHRFFGAIELVNQPDRSVLEFHQLSAWEGGSGDWTPLKPSVVSKTTNEHSKEHLLHRR